MSTSNDTIKQLLEALIKPKMEKGDTDEQIKLLFINTYGYNSDIIEQVLDKLNPKPVIPPVIEPVLMIPKVDKKEKADVPAEPPKKTNGLNFQFNNSYFPTSTPVNSPTIESAEVDDGFEMVTKTKKNGNTI